MTQIRISGPGWTVAIVRFQPGSIIATCFPPLRFPPLLLSPIVLRYFSLPFFTFLTMDFKLSPAEQKIFKEGFDLAISSLRESDFLATFIPPFTSVVKALGNATPSAPQKGFIQAIVEFMGKLPKDSRAESAQEVVSRSGPSG